MIINRYLIREIGKPLAVVLSVLSALFASYSAARFLSDAVNGLLPTGMIIELVALKTLIALDVLIPISLYASVVLALSRLYSDSEVTVMLALRVSPARVMGAVLTLSSFLALLVAGVSLVARPWAYQRLHELSNLAAASLNTGDMHAGTFYVGDHGNRVIFIERRNGPRAPGHRVFVQLKRRNSTRIIYAQLAEQIPGTRSDGGPKIRLLGAHVYDIGRGSDPGDRAMNANEIILDPANRDIAPPGYSALAASSARLATSGAADDVAEFQWRLSTPLSTLLLGMLGVPLSRSRPRQGKYARIGTAIAIYFGYYLLCTSARIWVRNGVISAFPGFWWVPALLALVLAVAFSTPAINFRRGRA